MSRKFGIVPPEVPCQRSLALVAPGFRVKVELLLAHLAGGRVEWPFETLRTPERQAYLYGFGRTYDDGRGEVTKASSAYTSWHGYGLALDIVEKDATPWDAPTSFWNEIGDAAKAVGLVWGGTWHRPDLPHVQWGRCPLTPTDADRTLLRAYGMPAVWAKYGAS